MPLLDLNHFLVLAKDIEASRRFYTEALGMRDAPRPWAPFPGAWLAIGEQVCLHLAQANDDPEMLHHFGREPGEKLHGSGAVDHVAFFASDMNEFEQRLKKHDIAFRRRSIPKSNLEQIFVEDPDGVTIELNFPVDAIGTAPLAQDEHASLRKASQAGTPAALYRLVAELAAKHLKPVVFSINARIGQSMDLQRVYSNNESAYPIGGRKNKEGTEFGKTVLLDAAVLASEGTDAIRKHFDDHERILALGGQSLLNVPASVDGICVGVINAVLSEPKVADRHVQVLQGLAVYIAAALQSQAAASQTHSLPDSK